MIQVVAAAACNGFIGIFGKRALEAGMRPGELLALRFLLAAAVLWAYVLIARRDLIRMPFRQIVYCVLLGVLGYATFSSLYFYALQGLSVSLATLLFYTYPILVALGSWLFLSEKITLIQGLSLPVLVIGLMLLLWGDITVEIRGFIVLGLGAAVFYGSYILASRPLVALVNPLSASLYIMTTAAIGLLIATPSALQHAAGFSADAWQALLGLAFVSTLVSMTLFLMGMKKLTSTEASLLSTLEPVTAVLAAVFLLGESISPRQISGGVIILCALLILSICRRSNELASVEINGKTD
jgi:drug/metabolite transporter (DMT)-like permease